MVAQFEPDRVPNQLRIIHYDGFHLIDGERLSTYYHNPKNFDELLLLLEAEGFEIKHCKYIALKGSGQKRFIHLDSLGEGIDQKRLLERFEEKTLCQIPFRT